MFLTGITGQIDCVSARVHIPWTGSWVADLELDTTIPPTGKYTLTVGTSTLVGTIDDDASGSFGQTSRVRLVGGLGWSKKVSALHLHNDAGVLTTAVLSATAAEVLESVVDSLPSVLGVDYVRAEGPASSVLAGLDWYVDPTGVTIAGPRVPKPADPSVDVLDWDARERVAVLSSTDLVMPGTVLTDTRFDGIATVRDVEQTIDASGSIAKARCVLGVADSLPSAGPKLARALFAAAQHAVGAVFHAPHRYRVITQAGDKVNLQRVSRKDGGPPEFLRSVPLWSGVAGTKMQFSPTAMVVVMFLDGDPSFPVVMGADPTTPALSVSIGSPSAEPLAKAPELAALLTSLINIVGAITTVQPGAPALALLPQVAGIATLLAKGA